MLKSVRFYSIHFGIAMAGSLFFTQMANSAQNAGSAFGDPAKGRAVFEGKGTCLSCHRVLDKGSRLGPDLTDVGARMSVDDLQKAILSPDTAVSPQYQMYRVVTKDGVTVTGKILNQDNYSLQMLDARDRLLAFTKTDLREYGFMDTPSMPSYRDKLSTGEVTDLVAYLFSLKGVKPQ